MSQRLNSDAQGLSQVWYTAQELRPQPQFPESTSAVRLRTVWALAAYEDTATYVWQVECSSQVLMACVLDELVSKATDMGTLRVLVADDRPDVLEALRLLLKGAGYQTETADSPGALLQAAETRRFDLILMDLNYTRDTTSGQEGLDVLTRLQAQESPPPVVVMTAWGNVDLAVEAMRRGACDFIQKPWDNARLLSTVRKQAGAARRARSELELARHIQQKLFPRKTKCLETIDYSGQCIPAREIGGDYYDFLDLGAGVLGLILADVSGKGIAAALLMANLQGSLRSQSDLALRHPPALMSAVNKLFYESTPPEQYATLFFGRYDDHTRSLRYLNCGHEPPLLLRRSGAVERLPATALPLGMFGEWSSEENSLELAPGDTLLLFSDGVTEAGLDCGREFGEQPLLALLAASQNEKIDAVVERIVGAVHNYSVAGQTDDFTVVGVRGR